MRVKARKRGGGRVRGLRMSSRASLRVRYLQLEVGQAMGMGMDTGQVLGQEQDKEQVWAKDGPV